MNFVKGFVGVVGPSASDACLRLPTTLEGFKQSRYSTRRVAILGFGESSATLNHLFGGDHRVWIKGRPFALAQEIRAKTRSGPATSDMQGVFENLDGKFALCTLNSDGGVVCATDILSAGSLYYCQSTNHVYFSTHLGCLLGVLPSVPAYDQLGLASFLGGGVSISGRSVYEGVGRLTPCSYMVIDCPGNGSSQLSLGKYADLVSLLLDRSWCDDPEAGSEHFGELMFESIQREAYGGKLGLMLSGGRDSRAIAYTLCRYGKTPFEAVTYGSWRSRDVRGARLVAHELSLIHRCVPYDHWDYSTYAGRITGLNGGASGLDGSSILVGYEEAARRFDIAAVGFLGDAATGAHLPRYETVGVEHVFRAILQTNEILEELYAKELGILRDEVMKSYGQLCELKPHQRHLYLDFTVRQATHISVVFDLADSFIDLSYPFFYRPLLQFLFNLPVRFLQRQLLYDFWLETEQGRLAELRGKNRQAIVENMKLYVSRRLHRVLGRLSKAPRLVNWRRVMKRSRRWLEHTAQKSCDDPRLHALCRLSIERFGEKASAAEYIKIVHAVTPGLARQYAYSAYRCHTGAT